MNELDFGLTNEELNAFGEAIILSTCEGGSEGGLG